MIASNIIQLLPCFHSVNPTLKSQLKMRKKKRRANMAETFEMGTLFKRERVLPSCETETCVQHLVLCGCC